MDDLPFWWSTGVVVVFNLIRKPSSFLCRATWNKPRTAKPCGPVVGWGGGRGRWPQCCLVRPHQGLVSFPVKQDRYQVPLSKGEAWELHESGRRKKWKYGMTVLYTWNWYYTVSQPYCNLKKKKEGKLTCYYKCSGKANSPPVWWKREAHFGKYRWVTCSANLDFLNKFLPN